MHIRRMHIQRSIRLLAAIIATAAALLLPASQGPAWAEPVCPTGTNWDNTIGACR